MIDIFYWYLLHWWWQNIEQPLIVWTISTIKTWKRLLEHLVYRKDMVVKTQLIWSWYLQPSQQSLKLFLKHRFVHNNSLTGWPIFVSARTLVFKEIFFSSPYWTDRVLFTLKKYLIRSFVTHLINTYLNLEKQQLQWSW